MGSLEIKEFTEAKTALKDIMTGMASYENMTISGKMAARLLDSNAEKFVNTDNEQ